MTRTSRLRFIESLRLPDGRRFAEVMVPFQQRDFEAMCNGSARHFFIERARGSSKTADAAALGVAVLFAGPSGGRIIAAAVDRDQGALLHEAAAGWIRRTPPLDRAARIERWKITVPQRDTSLLILAADAPSSWGYAPSRVIIDEFSEWPESAESLWVSLWSSLPKRRGSAVVITTPGWNRDSLAYRVRTIAQRDPSWHSSVTHEPAPWLDPETLEEQKRMLPVHVFERLFLGRWTDAGGAYLTFREVQTVFTDALPEDPGPRVIGCDLGVSRDSAAVALVRRAGQILCVEGVYSWIPRTNTRVDLQEVQDEIEVLAKRSGARVLLEEWQGGLMAAQLRTRGGMVEEGKPTAEGRGPRFSRLLDVVR